MKVCFFGRGSIGKRHLRNLCKIANKKNIDLVIHALRKTSTPLDEEFNNIVDRVIYEENELNSDYDIAFITNPTHMHYNTIQMMASKTKHMFIEKPITDYKNYDFDKVKLNRSGVYYVAGPLRFSSVIESLKNIIEKEKIFSVRVLCSSYLPDWRPNTDYREIYSAKKEQGGGVRVDLIHEWDYITHLFGFPKEVQYICGKYSDLEINSEDIAIYIARYEDKLVEIHLDYFGRLPRREIELLTDTGLITGNLIKDTITFNDRSDNVNFNPHRNDIYIREMEFFINNILSNKAINNIKHCIKVLGLTKGEV